MKGHESIRRLIEDTAKSLADYVDFHYARTSDFNLVRDKKSFSVVLDPMVATPAYSVDNHTNYVKTWLIQMAFYQKDKEASLPDEYSKILDDVDTFVDNFINKLNFYSTQASEITLSNFRQEPFIKATSGILTGYILTFQIETLDNFEYCEIEC